jgi:hypothetical protein
MEKLTYLPTIELSFCWPEALNQIRISDLALLTYLGNPLLKLGPRLFSLDRLLFGSDGVNQPLADGYVADSRSI